MQRNVASGAVRRRTEQQNQNRQDREIVIIQSANTKGLEWLGIDAGVVGPMRHGQLPTGNNHFNLGKAAAMLVHCKAYAYGRLLEMFALCKPLKRFLFDWGRGQSARDSIKQRPTEPWSYTTAPRLIAQGGTLCQCDANIRSNQEFM